MSVDTFLGDVLGGFERADRLKRVSILQLQVWDFFVTYVVNLVHIQRQSGRILEMVTVEFVWTMFALATSKRGWVAEVAACC